MSKPIQNLQLQNALDANSQLIQNLADPGSAQDAATRAYVDNTVSGLASLDAANVDVTARGQWKTALLLDSVDNTADVDKPVSGATQSALNLKLDTTVVIDEDDMTSDSDSHVPTQQSTKAYVDNAISSIPGATVLDEDDFASDSDTLPPSQQSTKAYVDNAISSIPSTTVLDEDDFASDSPTLAPSQQSVRVYNETQRSYWAEGIALATRYLARLEYESGRSISQAERAAIVKLSVEMARIGLSKFKAVYPMLGGTAAAHALDLMGGPSLAWNGTVTHGTNGADGDGSTGWAATPYTLSDFNPANLHCLFSGTSFETSGSSFMAMGAWEDADNYLHFMTHKATDTGQFGVEMSSGSGEYTVKLQNHDDGAGVLCITNNGTNVSTYEDSASTASASNTTTDWSGLTTAKIGILSRQSGANPTGAVCNFASLGQYLTFAEVTRISPLINALTAARGTAASDTFPTSTAWASTDLDVTTGRVFARTLSADLTIGTVSNLPVNVPIVLQLTASGADRTVTIPASHYAADHAPVITDGETVEFVVESNGTDVFWRAGQGMTRS